MSHYLRKRKIRNRDFKKRLKWNNGSDRTVRNWQLIDVHEISVEIEGQDEFDFWANNGKDTYLFCLRKTKETAFYIVKSKGSDSRISLIAECDFSTINNKLLNSILLEFERFGIPRFSIKKINLKF